MIELVTLEPMPDTDRIDHLQELMERAERARSEYEFALLALRLATDAVNGNQATLRQKPDRRQESRDE